MILHWVICFVLVGWCVFLLQRFGVIERSKKAVSITLDSLGTIQNPALNDDDKEAALRKHSIQLFKLAFAMLPGIAGAILLPMAGAMGGHYLGWISLETLMSVLYSPAFLIASALTAIVFIPRKKEADESSVYSSSDQMLHRIAFRTALAQIWLAKRESRWFARRLAICSVDNPVFITALPRAGTTLLLECLADHPELASHCYRDMPFVLSPYLWNRFSSRFQKKGARRERAHGDGMKIDFDSPEALEEVVWKNFWHEQYLDDRIRPWGGGANHQFISFFKDHLRKIILTRRKHDIGNVRYISKNNLNTARIDFLCTHFPESTIVILFRDPLQHAASLLKQHEGFLNMHEQDPFVEEYMEAIGHFDFGANLKPVDFDGWLDRRTVDDPLQLAFWVEYWQACYRHLLHVAEGRSIHFIHYDRLCRQPEVELDSLGRKLGLRNLEPLLRHAREIRPPRPHVMEESCISAALRESAYAVYGQLQEKSMGAGEQPELALMEEAV